MYPWQNFIIGLTEHLAWPILVATCIYTFKEDIQNYYLGLRNYQVVQN